MAKDRFRSVEPPPLYPKGRPQRLTADAGRQGPSVRRVLVVLVLSLIAAIILWGVGGTLHRW